MLTVLANSLPASIFSLMHAYQLSKRPQGVEPECYSWPGDLLIVGIIANYCCVAADTFSSELGILSKSQPRLITSLNFRKVPPGTNGGVTGTGLASGLLGSLVITAAAMALTPFCAPPTVRGAIGWNLRGRNRFSFAMALWGAFGSVVDSLLGGWLQSSVVDTRTGKIVEGEGGKRVLVSKASGRNSMHVKKSLEVKKRILQGEGKEATAKQVGAGGETVSVKKGSLNEGVADHLISDENKPSRVVESGRLGLLDNNEVNFLMATLMSVGAIAIASWFWEVPLSTIFDFKPEIELL